MLMGGQNDGAPANEASDSADVSLVSSAFSGSGSIKCDYSQDGLTGTAYVKNGKVRIEGMVDGGTANVIYGNGKVYTWGESNGYDYAFMIEAPTADAEVAAGTQALPSRADIENQFSSGSVRCESYNVSESFFVAPPGINFQSMTDLINMAPAGAGPAAY